MYRRQGANGARNGSGGRASVKSQSQRRVNQKQQQQQQAPLRGVAAKKKNGQKENNNAKQNNAAPVGVSGVSLSNRFSSLQKEAVTQHPMQSNKPKKNAANVMVKVKKNQPGKLTQKPVAPRKAAKQQQQVQQKQKQQQQKQKMQQVTQASRTKRQATVNQRRKGLAVAAPAKGNKSKPNAAATAQKKNKKNAPAGQKPKDNKKKPVAPVTGDDLDVEMDAYWHQAGKGPDPHQAQLDRQMEQYWAEKPKRGEDATASAAPQNEATMA